MPTQEERVTTLEQSFTSSQREQARQNRKIDENLTILLGLVQTQSIEIKRIFARLDTMEQRFDSVDLRFDGVEQRLGSVERHLGTMDQRLGTIETDTREVKTLLTQLVKNSQK